MDRQKRQDRVRYIKIARYALIYPLRGDVFEGKKLYKYSLLCHLSIRDKGAGTFPSRKSAQKARRNREKTNKERETLSLILIEYLKSARNKRGRATYRAKQPHAIQQRVVVCTLARTRTRSK